MNVIFTSSKQIQMPCNLSIAFKNRQPPLLRRPPPKEKVVVVLGATGTGKSRLSIDLAKFFGGEIIISDKMQLYKGLDIATNKITVDQRRGVPHHLLGIVPPDSEFSPADFGAAASLSLRSTIGRDHVPIIVGGSCSFIEALVGNANFRSRYDFCFLWVDVAPPVLHSIVSDRVDKMVERGMVDEIRSLFEPNADYTKGIRRAIGVAELDGFFRVESVSDEPTRARILAEAVDEIKMNTTRLAGRQLEKIGRLMNTNAWNIHRLEATEALRRRGGEVEAEAEAEAAWEDLVVRPSVEIVRRFLDDWVAMG